MKGNYTFTIIKPCAVQSGHIGAILGDIADAGFRVAALKFVRLNKKEAQEFYKIHEERPFYGELVDFMTSGPIVVAVLEKEGAVEGFRSLIGSTNPKEAAPDTIRAKYAESIGRNAIHGSDSDDNAKIEASFFFSRNEIFNSEGGFVENLNAAQVAS
ncbi:nucleoside diphosphate kinase [Fulvitalea axinellae]|uniref:Nucleoside diphosphate kinase n=1 Tax=Fulvitalea axinellae TaxID=1182444 RepID=A0AAU9CAN0_9BACT|nr:nucleoside diphosphate kinase [Fulvitalea axinellae]